MTTSPASQDPDASSTEGLTPAEAHAHSHTHGHPHTAHPDPLTGEPDAHPVGVGVGALAAGAAGAAVGAFLGPVGLVVGAAIGAIAGGLAGKDAAESSDISPTEDETSDLDEFEHPGTARAVDEESLPASIEERVNPPEDAFITGGTLSGKDPDAAVATDRLDEFDRPHDAASASSSTRHSDLLEKYGSEDDNDPLPTASSGLVTPDESSLFADSGVTGDRTTGESGFLTESPLTAARAVSPGDRFADTPVSSPEETVAAAEPASTPVESALTSESPVGAEDTVRTTAYYRYLDRAEHGQPGSDFEDWIAAEKDVRHR